MQGSMWVHHTGIVYADALHMHCSSACATDALFMCMHYKCFVQANAPDMHCSRACTTQVHRDALHIHLLRVFATETYNTDVMYMAHLIVLGNDHVSSSGEVEGDRGLVASQVVNVEHDGLWQILLAAPDDPPEAGVHQSIPGVGGGKTQR